MSSGKSTEVEISGSSIVIPKDDNNTQENLTEEENTKDN